jgi:hypothetical protein
MLPEATEDLRTLVMGPAAREPGPGIAATCEEGAKGVSGTISVGSPNPPGVTPGSRPIAILVSAKDAGDPKAVCDLVLAVARSLGLRGQRETSTRVIVYGTSAWASGDDKVKIRVEKF